MRPARLLVTAVVAVLASAAARAQDFMQLPWRLSPAGRLEVQLLKDGGVGAAELSLGEWVPMFPDLLEKKANGESSGFGELTRWGPFKLLPLLVHGDGGAAAIDEAVHRMRKLSQPMIVESAALRMLRPDPLLDLLRVKYLGDVGTYSALHALADLASDARRDAFVRAAAAGELAQHPRPEEELQNEDPAKVRPRRNGVAALQAGLARLPDDADLVMGLHGAVLPTMAPLLAAWREMQVRFSSTVVLAAGGSMTMDQLSLGQMAIDQPGQLPFELARRVGNWRVDHALLALRHGEVDAWWCHLGGVFQLARLRDGLEGAGAHLRPGSDTEVSAAIHGWNLQATATGLEVWSDGWDVPGRGALMPLLHDRASAGSAPVWAFLPPRSQLGREIDAVGCAIDVRLHVSPRSLTATARCPDDKAAQRLVTSWRAWQQERRANPDEKVPGSDHVTWRDVAELPPGVAEDSQLRLVWRRCVQAVGCAVESAGVSWKLDLAPFSLVELVGLLADSPLAILRDG